MNAAQLDLILNHIQISVGDTVGDNLMVLTDTYGNSDPDRYLDLPDGEILAKLEQLEKDLNLVVLKINSTRDTFVKSGPLTPRPKYDLESPMGELLSCIRIGHELGVQERDTESASQYQIFNTLYKTACESVHDYEQELLDESELDNKVTEMARELKEHMKIFTVHPEFRDYTVGHLDSYLANK